MIVEGSIYRSAYLHCFDTVNIEYQTEKKCLKSSYQMI